jgi:hypothetical protein
MLSGVGKKVVGSSMRAAAGLRALPTTQWRLYSASSVLLRDATRTE